MERTISSDVSFIHPADDLIQVFNRSERAFDYPSRARQPMNTESEFLPYDLNTSQSHGGDMAWIRIVEESEAGDALLKVYQQVKGSRGKISNILAVHSLHPSALQAHMDLYMAIVFGPSGLSRKEREMIAVVVSSADQCPYCIQHHAAALSHYWKDEEKLTRFTEDYRSIDLTPKMEAVLDYAFKLTTTPHTMTETDVERLRKNNLADEEILTVNLIASYFNFVNRIALGLGVAFTADEVKGYKY